MSVAEILTVLVDIGLGALAYKIARETRARTTTLEAHATRTNLRLDALETRRS